MSGVLHPVGPEPTQTYWLRRALVVGTLIIVVAILVALLVNRDPGATAVPAAPASTTSSAPLDSPIPSPSAPSTSTPSSSTSSSATASGKPSVKPSTSAKPSKSDKPSSTPTVVQPIACNPAELRPTLTGKKKLKPKEDNTFTLSLINGARTTCVATLNASVFELKIYSGKDRIWSTDDCASLVKPFRAILASEKAIEWTMTWNGRRSAEDCKNRPQIPKAGTYFATAQLEGAKPVQLRMIVRG